MAERKEGLTLASGEAMACPFPIYDAMRDCSPAYRDALTGFYVVTDYADLRSVLADPVTFSSTVDIVARGSDARDEIERMYRDAGLEVKETIVTADPPRHRRYRSLVDKVFSPRRVRGMEQSIAALVDGLIARFPATTLDFVEHFAMPLPMSIIADQLGLAQDRHADFRRWSEASVDSVNQGRTPEEEIETTRQMIEMRLFFCEEVERVRRAPTGSLLSALANTENDDGERMSPGELSLLLQILLAAGNQTTTHAIGSGLYQLAKDRRLQARLRDAPGLVPAFVEEVLRLFAPLQGLFRTATRPAMIGNVQIEKGGIINVRFAAANRDPAQFTCPAEADLTRGSAAHVTFGFGIHHCIGSQLARAELRLSFERLLAGSSAIGLAADPDAVVFAPHFMTYGPKRLMIDYQRR